MAQFKTKEYTNGEVTVVWEPQKCIHSGICVRGLGEVFDPKAKPWINVENSNTARIVDQVKQCPSGAISFYMNDEADKTAETLETKVEVLAIGPLLVYGTLRVADKAGTGTIKNKTTAFSRLGPLAS